MIRSMIFCLVCVAVLILAGFAKGAMAGVTIVAIEESKLDELLGSKENRLVVNFMAAWCGPCIDELPVLNKLYRKFNKKGLQMIGISIDIEGPGAMQPIVNKLKIDFPIYGYGEKSVKKFKLNAIPMIFLIKDGEIIEKLWGRRSERDLNKKFQQFLK